MNIVTHIFLNTQAFLSWEASSTAFWILLGLFVLFYYLSMTMTEESPKTYILMNLLCAGTVYLYSGLSGEIFWFLNIERVGWLLLLFALMLTGVLFGIIWGNAWGHLKLVTSAFSNFQVRLVGLIIGCVWVLLLIRLVGIVFEEHPILCVISLLGGLSTSSTSKSTGYSQNPSSSDTGSTSHGSYHPQGFPCCDNCKWNQSRGSYFVRCSQDSNRIKEPNDKCGQWQRC